MLDVIDTAGTPIQNNLEELWALMRLVAPRFFNDAEAFADHFAAINYRVKIVRPYI